jgi:hypothetical protein
MLDLTVPERGLSDSGNVRDELTAEQEPPDRLFQNSSGASRTFASRTLEP